MSPFRMACTAFAGVLAVGAAPDPPVLTYRPAHSELRYTFGGAPEIRRVAPGTRIVSWTEDCYDGAVTRPGQMPTQVIPPGHDNPPQNARAPIVQMVDPQYTVLVRIPKARLPTASPAPARPAPGPR